MPPPFTSHEFSLADVNPYILTPAERQGLIARLSKARYQGAFTPIGYDDAVHMPGNQGGANWGMTSANPTDGSVYVIAFNYPTLIKAVETKQAVRGGDSPGYAIYAQNCAMCHGTDRLGQSGEFPALTGVSTRLSKAEIQSTIQNGKGQMPGFHPVHHCRCRFLDDVSHSGGYGARSTPESWRATHDLPHRTDC